MSASARRPYGEGAVYPIANGKWIASLGVGKTASGTRKRKTATRSTESAARQALEDLKMLHARGNVAPVGHSSQTFRVYAQNWLTNHAPLGRRKPRTVEQYRSILEAYVYQFIGEARLERLSPDDLARMFGTLSDTPGLGRSGQGLSPNTVLQVRRTISVVLNQAVKQGVLFRNPLELTDSPRRPEPITDYHLSVEDVRDVMEVKPSDVGVIAGDEERTFSIPTGSSGDC